MSGDGRRSLAKCFSEPSSLRSAPLCSAVLLPRGRRPRGGGARRGWGSGRGGGAPHSPAPAGSERGSAALPRGVPAGKGKRPGGSCSQPEEEERNSAAIREAEEPPSPKPQSPPPPRPPPPSPPPQPPKTSAARKNQQTNTALTAGREGAGSVRRGGGGDDGDDDDGERPPPPPRAGSAEPGGGTHLHPAGSCVAPRRRAVPPRPRAHLPAAALSAPPRGEPRAGGSPGPPALVPSASCGRLPAPSHSRPPTSSPRAPSTVTILSVPHEDPRSREAAHIVQACSAPQGGCAAPKSPSRRAQHTASPAALDAWCGAAPLPCPAPKA